MVATLGVDEVVFEDLKKQYDARNVVVFAGAGVSAGAGLPTWKRLADGLVERMRQTNKPAEAIAEAEDFIRQGNLVHAMSAARSALRIEFDRELERRLDDETHDVPAVAKAIADLGPKLAGVVTTNLDRLLERALGGGWPAIVKPVADLVQRPRYIFKPHGTIDDADTWVFTRDEYDQAMFGSPALQDLFAALYRARTLLFVGASLTDDDFGLTLGRIRALAGRNPPTHYAILPGPIGPSRREQLEKAGIRLLVYENKSGTHHEVVEILQALAGVATASPSAPLTSASPPVAAPTAAVAAVASKPPALSKKAAPSAPIDVYLSAAPKDVALRDRLDQQLAFLERANLVRVEHEGDVRPGSDRKKVARAALDRARIVLLLLSAEYLASADHEEEMQLALARADAGKAIVVPVVLRPCLWQLAFGARELQPLPDGGKPVTTWANQDEALQSIVLGVKALAATL
jgi:hypothetical protein